MYGLMKQATEGDNETERPWMLQRTATAHWYAWNEMKGMPKEHAKNEYIKLVNELLGDP